MKENKHIELLYKFLDATCDKNELQELNSIWGHSEQIDEWILHQWDKADSEIPVQLEEKMYSEITTKCRKHKNNKWINIYKVAAVILILFTTGLAGYMLNQASIEDYMDNKYLVNVESGQRADIMLPDGTRVWINSGSSISYNNNYNKKDRIINLDGEAYFEVAKKEDIPFIVNTEKFNVTALGTAFNVKAYKEDDQATTSLISGSIEVKTSHSTELLSPNQQLLYDKVSGMTYIYTKDNITNNITWKDNLLFFDDDNFETLAKELTRRYNIDFVFADEKVKQYSFTGTLKMDDIETVLDILTATSPTTYKKNENTYTFSINTKDVKYYE